MSNQTLNLTPTLYAYLQNVSLRESKLLMRLRKETQQLDMAVMQISPEQGQFMALIVELIAARKIVEVGTFTGYSALCMAMAQPEGGHIYCCDISAEWTAIGQRYWQEAGVSDQVTLKLAPALETLALLEAQHGQGSFDMAFIDADKRNYLAYYEACLRLLRPGGLLLIDNTLWGGAVIDDTDQSVDTQAIRDLNHKLYEDDRINLSLLPLSDGLTMALKQ